MKYSTSAATDPNISKWWGKHVEAHNSMDVKDMAATYSDDCYISYYNVADKKRTEFKGVEGKNAFSKEHLNSLMMRDGNPTTDIDVKNFFFGKSLFNQWNIKSDNFSYKDGADLFLFNDEGLITHQYQWYFGTKFVEKFESTKDPENSTAPVTSVASTQIAAGPSSCFGAHHHFVGIGDLEGVLDTFTEDVFISFFNITTNKSQEFKGQKEARAFYTAFFKLMGTIPAGDFKEGEGAATNGSEPKDTFSFDWRAPKAGIKKASDMFVFGEGNKISQLWMCYECPKIEV